MANDQVGNLVSFKVVNGGLKLVFLINNNIAITLDKQAGTQAGRQGRSMF